MQGMALLKSYLNDYIYKYIYYYYLALIVPYYHILCLHYNNILHIQTSLVCISYKAVMIKMK